MTAPWRNLILASLPEAETVAIAARLKRLQLERNHVLFSSGASMDRVLFPEDCIVSLTVELPDGRNVEGGAIGYEGVAGVGGTFANEHSFTLQSVMVAGAGHVIDRQGLLELQPACPRLFAAIDSYRDCFVAYLLQSIACVGAHGAEERLARWLLDILDRTTRAEMIFTHESIAMMIGVSRPTVTLLLRTYESAQLIETQRGRIKLMDRQALEDIACSCYATVRGVYRRSGLLPDPDKETT